MAALSGHEEIIWHQFCWGNLCLVVAMVTSSFIAPSK